MWKPIAGFCLGLYLMAATVWVLLSGQTPDELLNASCDPTRELWRDVNAAFLRDYQAKTGRQLVIRQSHGGSGSQARAVIDGLEADVATLALWSDTDAIRKAGRIAPGWQDRWPNRSLPLTSTIVMVVRKGNPKQITDWPDLLKPNIQVITPSPKTSGNGKWSFLALWGAVLHRGGTPDEARDFTSQVFGRVPVLDSSARAATMTFAQKQIGDVHLTWENEAHLEVKESRGALEIVYPKASILAEPHVAIVDAVVDRKGTREVAEAYLAFLYTEPAQELIAKHYYRPIHEQVKQRTAHQFPEMVLYSITSIAADWDEIHRLFFAEGAEFDRIAARGRQS